jgi:hypothetical protein
VGFFRLTAWSDRFMTAHPRSHAVDYAAATAAEPVVASRTPPDETPNGMWPDRIVFPTLAVALLLIYGLLQNPYWVPAGDSELYAAAARNLATGRGYTFLGQPVAISPPGWSLLMAGVMKVTPYVWPLKLLAMTCLIGSLLIGYRVARRFVSPMKAAAIILLTAIISHVYQASYWLISEGSFCLATAGSILLAMQIAEGKRHWSRIALLLVCCAAAVSIRWAGVLGVIVVVAALLDGQWKPRLTTPWVASLLVVIVSLATFYAWRVGLRGTPEQIAAAQNMITGTGEDTGTMPVAEVTPPVTGTVNQSAGTYELFPPGSYIDRFLNWGRWFSYLYWQVFRAAGAKAWIFAIATTAGWVLIGVLGVLVFQTARRKKWIWLATGAYTGALAIGWPNINARYFVPVAFLITLAIFLATDELVRLSERRRWLRLTWVGCFLAFVGSVVVCNGALYAVETAIARSEKFYARYETGMNVPLIAACQYLVDDLPPDQRPKDREIAVSPRYTNLNKTKASPFGIRATVWLTDREVITPKWVDTNGPPNNNPRLRRWLRSKGIKWYLYQPDISPWRVWHFRLGWYERWQTGKTAEQDSAGWQLYRIAEDGDATLIKTPRRCDPVTRVPGL